MFYSQDFIYLIAESQLHPEKEFVQISFYKDIRWLSSVILETLTGSDTGVNLSEVNIFCVFLSQSFR